MSGARLEGQRALVVGGGSGIGLAAAQALAAAGAAVTIAGRTIGKLEAARDASPVPLSVARLDGSVEAEVAAFFRDFGAFEHLVLCANAGGAVGPFRDLDVGAMRNYFDSKLWTYLHTVKYAAPHLTRQGSVTLVNGAASQFAVPGMGALAVVNGGLDALVKPLAVEFAPVRVNAVAPGLIDTPYWARLPAAQRERMYADAARGVPAQRVGTAEDVADAILFLCGNGFVTGTVMLVDGGRHLTPNIA